MKRKNKKIRYYGGKPSNTGYLFGISPSLQGLQYLQQTNMNPQADALKNTIIPRAIGSLSASIPAVNNAFTNYITTNKALSSLVGTKLTETQAQALAGNGFNGLRAGAEITQNTANLLGSEGLKALGVKTGMNALGYVTAAAGALQGGIGLAQDIGNWNNDRVTSNDLLNVSGKSTGVINGRMYDRYESFDKAGMDRYVDQMNTRDTISTVGNGASIGGSIGSIFGPLGMGIGAGIGALGGWIGSLFGGKSRKDEYKRAIRDWNTTRNAYNTQQESVAASLGIGDEFYNDRMYGAKRGKSSHGGMYGAVRGKTSNGDMYKKGSRNSHIEIGPIETDEGVKFGPIRSNVSVGESIVNFEKGTAHYIRGKSSRRGKDLEHSDEAPGTPGFIAGFVPNPITGNYIADDAKPHAEKIENNNQLKEYAMNNTKGTTLDVLLSQIEKDNNLHFAALKWLEGIQDNMNNKKDILAMGNYKCGKHSYATGKEPFVFPIEEMDPYVFNTVQLPFADLGKIITPTRGIREPWDYPSVEIIGENAPSYQTSKPAEEKKLQNQFTHTPTDGDSFLSGLAQFAPYAMQSLYPLNELAHYKGTPIRTESSYKANPYSEQAINMMKNRSFDIYNPLLAINSLKRQSLYDVMHSAVNPAAKMGLLAKLNAQIMDQTSGLWAQKRNEDNKYAAETAQLAAKLGEEQAQRGQQASLAEIQQKIAAQGKKDEGIGKAWKGFSNIAEGFAKHALSAQQMEEMKKLYRAQIRAYDTDFEKNNALLRNYNAGTHDIDGRLIQSPIKKFVFPNIPSLQYDMTPIVQSPNMLWRTYYKGE